MDFPRPRAELRRVGYLMRALAALGAILRLRGKKITGPADLLRIY
jgi:hypothetical protein